MKPLQKPLPLQEEDDDAIKIRVRKKSVPAKRPLPSSQRKMPPVVRASDKSVSSAAKKEAEAEEKKSSPGKRIGRFLARCAILLLAIVLLALYSVYALGKTVAEGPSKTLRNQLVMMALQASATKWAPGLFLEEEEVAAILADSKVITKEEIRIDDILPDAPDDPSQPDEWADAVNGILYRTENYSGFKAYIAIIRDPSRVFVGVSTKDFDTATEGLRIWDAANRYSAILAINAGEFRDTATDNKGARPIGLTYSGGNCVWDDGVTNHTFIGFDKDNKLIVTEKMSKSQADALGIRDAVMFQQDNLLISNDGVTVTAYRRDQDTGTAQRTAIGQRGDGSVILLVTDGRTASSIGATKNDIIDVMLSLGAVTAGMLDGGSSAMMYYRNYFDIYGLDKTTLDSYQLKGIVNKYKAFTTPRRLPTFFMVTGGEG